MKYTLAVLALCVIAVCIYLFFIKESVRMQSAEDTLESVRPADIARRIADAYMQNTYPNFKRGGCVLKSMDIQQIVNDPRFTKGEGWHVVYDCDEEDGARVELIINVDTESIVSIKDTWS